MATPAIQQRTTPNPEIITAPEEPVADSQLPQDEIPVVIQEALETPHVSKGFSGKLGRYSERYAKNKLKTDYLTQI